MRLLDLFCGAGGAAMGYHRAGFEVGPTRLPLCPADAKTAALLDKLLAEIQVDLPIPAVR